MKKVVSVIITIIMVITMAIPAFAKESEIDILTDEILLTMTTEDLVNCYDYLLEYKTDNSTCTNQDLDIVASDYFITLYKEKEDTPVVMSWYDDLLVSYGGLNSEELELARQYPSDLAAVYSSAKIANEQATSRYYLGEYLGNQDAFRHAAWNALMICRFYALGKGDFNWCLNRTREWTNAHEYGEEVNYDLSASQRSTDHEMDILNNMAGRAAAETTYRSESSALAEVQQYVDNGYCKKIKADWQMSYSYDEMRSISSWTLSESNTVGKG